MTRAPVALQTFRARAVARQSLDGIRRAEYEIGMPEVGKEDCEELGRNDSDGQYFSGKLHRS